MPGYQLAGIAIESDLDLPLPKPRISAEGAEVFLQVGHPLSDDEIPAEPGWHWTSPGEASFNYPDLGRAWVSQGKRILLRPCAGRASGTEWRGLIIPCFAALFHQRGALSLHASAVCADGRAFGFMGYSGAGKSTLVAQLVGQGRRFLCDDLLLLGDRDDGDGYIAHPGFSIIKLWEDALKAAGGGFSRIGRLYPNAPKDGFSPGEAESSAAPAPLECMFVLAEGDEVKVESLSRRDALAELLQHTYGVQVFEQKPLPVHFRQCGELAAKVPVKRLTRPKSFDCTGEVERAISEALDEETEPRNSGMAV